MTHEQLRTAAAGKQLSLEQIERALFRCHGYNIPNELLREFLFAEPL